MEILNQFGINPMLLAAQVVNFFILLLILKKFMYKPLLKVLDERKQKIAESLKNAEEIELKLQSTNEQIDKMMAKTSDEIQQMHDETKKENALLKEMGKKEVEVQAAIILQKAQEAVRAESNKMREEIRDELATLVELALQKVTGKIVTKEDQKKIIEREVKNIS